MERESINCVDEIKRSLKCMYKLRLKESGGPFSKLESTKIWSK